MSGAGRARLASALTLTLCAAAASRGAGETPTEHEVKAAYLYNFAKYVEWPSAAAAGPSWIVGVLGDEGFGDVLERTLEGKTVKGRAFVARRFRDAAHASQAHILYIAASEESRLAQILKALEGTSVLTVSDIERFAERGGVIGFRMDGKRVRFDISPDRASRSGLRISSQLLTLARVVPSR